MTGRILTRWFRQVTLLSMPSDSAGLVSWVVVSLSASSSSSITCILTEIVSQGQYLSTGYFSSEAQDSVRWDYYRTG